MSEQKEETGFKVSDKRFFSQSEEDREKSSEEDTIKQETKKQETKNEDSTIPPPPEANFPMLIFSLSSSAMMYMGEIENPGTNSKEKNLPAAKHTVDTITMLKEKTKGNLSKDEETLIDNILYDLRIKYVDAAK